MAEINEAAKLVATTADPGARIIFGAYYDKNLKPNQVKVTIVASGFNGNGGQPSMLFGGANSHFGERYSVFSGGSASNDAPLAKKTFTSPQAEIKGAAPSGSSPREFGEKGGAPLTFGDDKKKEVKNAKDNKEARDKEDDAWDIPAFLRRRKK
jgi:hypothetical protein